MNRDSFVFYKNYKDAIEIIKDDDTRLEFYDTITDYVFYGKQPNPKHKLVNSIFIAIKKELDTETKAYRNFKERNSSEYRKFKQIVLKRDDYKCQLCGAEENLVVHHIASFAKNKELRTDINNGITLCQLCHKEVHKNEQK